jgi:pyrimidine-nucleoside phosphorylase
MSEEQNNEKSTKPSGFNIRNFLRTKRDGKEHSPGDIETFVSEFSKNNYPDYLVSSWLMAAYLQGLTTKETAELTKSMLHSGKVLDFNDQSVIDKHSTGGIGDKASFILAPIAAACGVKVPMIAGRGLGHTGGTVDKIESVKNFQTSMKMDQFQKTVEQHKMAMIGATEEIAPADKILYGLRDVTQTVESIPLITASIMSKKLAEGTSGLVMDIKFGQGAFMKTKKDAKALALSIEKTALNFNKNIMTFITDMSQPLGHAVGNSLEVIESIETLKNKGPKDLTDLSCQLAAGMIFLAGKSKSFKEGLKFAKNSLKDGSALREFENFIERQGGDPLITKDYSTLPVALEQTHFYSPRPGYLHAIDNSYLGEICIELGGGRKVAGEMIDHSVGIIFHKKIGSRINTKQPVLTIYHHKRQEKDVNNICESLNKRITIKKEKPLKINPLILESRIKWGNKNV